MVFAVMADYGFFFSASYSQQRDQHDFTDAAAADFVQGVRRGVDGSVARGVQLVGGTSAPGPLTVTRLNGVQVIRHVVELIVPPDRRDDITDRMLFYHFVGRHGTVSIAYYCDATRVAAVQAIADRLTAAVQLPPALPARTAAYDVGYRLGHLVGKLLCALLVIGGIAGSRHLCKQGSAPRIAPLTES